MKKIILVFIFLFLLFLSINRLNEILISKPNNRYYMLEKELEKNNKFYDLQIFGSCHAYTSFNPTYLKEISEIDSYNYANPGEIIPTTYLRMKEQFKRHVPKVALVEIWGINPYETYDKTENILGYYLTNNIELIPFSLDKLEVINDFNLNVVEMNFPIYKYKDRIAKNTLSSLDFNYKFEDTQSFGYESAYNEMENRFSHNGFKAYISNPIDNYYTKQEKINENEFLKIESVIVKYIEKIIDLCKKYNVELIFYRAPYLSTKNELLKLKHFEQIVKKHNIQYIDLEKFIKYSFKEDYYDEHHLSEIGANISTKYIYDSYLKDIFK